jgi:hypothetical protein
VVRALRVHGVPTWQDVHDLGPHSTSAQVREVLADPATAAALLWITPDLGDSDFIADVELPDIIERVARRDGFFVQLVAAGGQAPGAAGELASRRLGVANPAHWNVMGTGSDPLDDADATLVARAVLRQRLRAIDAHLPPGAPLELELDTWRQPPVEQQPAVQMDWSEHFSTPRFPDPRTWTEELAPALDAVAEAIAVHCPGRPLRAQGRLTLGVALALGHSLRDPAATPLTWAQYHEGTWVDWSLGAPLEHSDVTVRREEHDPSSTTLALLVSARQPVEPAFVNTRASLPTLRGVIHVSWPGAITQATMTVGQGVDIAHRVRQALVHTRSEWRLRGGAIHLFLSAPTGLAVLMGQQLGTFGPVTVHEHVEERNAYARSLTFGPPEVPTSS